MNDKSQNWHAFQVERRRVADLKPYKNNARTHSPEQVAQIAASIKEFEFTNPLKGGKGQRADWGRPKILSKAQVKAAA